VLDTRDRLQSCWMGSSDLIDLASVEAAEQNVGGWRLEVGGWKLEVGG